MTEYKINPQASEVEIGTRRLRTIKIFPLSVGDQIDLTNNLAGSIGDFLNKNDMLSGLLDPSVEISVEQTGGLVVFMSDLIKDNLKKILSFVIDEGEDAERITKEITNSQALDIVNVIFEKNFGENLKNAKSLFDKVKLMFRITSKESIESSPQSVNDMDTDLETSSNLSEGAV